ncbi:MAG TPA: LptF/LptG family permease [Phycisphaerae bacterium]|nr:LptF/LptG family permease [Phycisphaerae bacterium]
MRILDRYILRNFLYSYVLSLCVLISLYVVLDLFVNLDEFTENRKPVLEVGRDIFDYYIYNVPLYFAQLSGVITAFAACVTLARLQRQNELVAILASGTSLYRVATPIVLASLAMNGLLVLDQEFLLPHVAPKLARERDDVEGLRSYGIWCVRDGDNRLLSAQYFSPKQQEIRGLMVMELNRSVNQRAQLGDVITATRARWNRERHGWDLTQRGMRIMAAEAVTGGMTSEASVTRVPLDFYPCELTPDELLSRQNAQWIQFLSVRELNRMQRQPDDNLRRQIAQIKHGRFTLPISNMILLLLGMSYFMCRLPNSVLTQGAKALATCATAFMVTFIAQQLVASGSFPPELPAWLPIILFTPVVAVLMDNVKT